MPERPVERRPQPRPTRSPRSRGPHRPHRNRRLPSSSYRGRPVLLAAMALGMVASSGDAAGQQPALEQVLREHALPLSLEGDSLEGPGAELLISEGRSARFFLIGEEHGVTEIPMLTGALFRALVPAGYRHLAIETGEGMAVRLAEQATAADPMTSMTRFQEQHWPGAPFYHLRTEAELLADVARAAADANAPHLGSAESPESPESPERPESPILKDPLPVFWGLDYDILLDRHGFHRLRELASTAAQRAAADRAIAASDSALQRALGEANPAHAIMFGGSPDLFRSLRAAFDPAEGSEADAILDLAEETLAINRHFGAGKGWRSNQRRARWIVTRFGRFWEAATADGRDAPRIMFKFGANHVVRGVNFTGTFDIGSAAAALADLRGEESFHLLAIGGPGTLHATLNPTVFEYVPVPARIAATPWGSPFARAADPDTWTLFDLRPLRPLVAGGALGELPPDVVRVIHGFDAVVVLGGSTPAEMLEMERPFQGDGSRGSG